MPQQTSLLAVLIFLVFTGFTLGLSFWLGRRAKTASGYFAAHGQVGWFVNGIAFAGDYLSAASFLGICGMIAFHGYDGFLYSIGFLAGWIVALFVIAEPIKKLGKYTFADALDAKFGSRGIKLAAAISTLVVSIFYLIPQMVGAGALIKPLLGLPHYAGVLIVGTVVIIIVLTAGMVSTTWVQFIKGTLLVIFCGMLTIAILARGLPVTPNVDTTTPVTVLTGQSPPKSGIIVAAPAHPPGDPSLGPIQYIANLDGTQILQYKKPATPNADGSFTYTPSVVNAGDLLVPGGHPLFKGVRSENFFDRLDFISLMLALFCGTASLPHILIRYYTVKDALSARKSTVVGIASIGAFYVLTLYIGLGAMVSGNIDPSDPNTPAPLLAKTFGDLPFALITAIAFTTVLGTVSGLILAASGAVAHDLMEHVLGHKLQDDAKVRAAKWSALVVGVVAMLLGIKFEGLNVGFLVGWAFNVAASANLPALIMLLFWKGTTRQGIIASVLIGLFTSLGWLLVSGEAMTKVYGYKDATNALVPFSQPGIVTIPLAFIVLIVVSLLTRRKAA